MHNIDKISWKNSVNILKLFLFKLSAIHKKKSIFQIKSQIREILHKDALPRDFSKNHFRE